MIIQVRVSGRDQHKFRQFVHPFPSSQVLRDALDLGKDVISLGKHSLEYVPLGKPTLSFL